MKNILMIFISVLVVSITNAQDINDALRYSFDEIEGTARFKAMGGAFGALGGDLSAININPAGAAVFNSSEASLTLGGFNKDNSVGYFNGLTTSSNSNIDLNQTGAAFVFRNYNDSSPWKKFVLSIAYDRFSDFDNDWIANGTNPNNSIGNYFLDYAQGNRLDEISAFQGETISEAYADIGSIYGFGNQQAFLGYESFIIDPVDDTDENTVYTSNISGTNFNQRYVYASRGYNGKLAFNFATQYDDKIYFGINLNSHFINYERSTFLSENNSNASSSVTNVDFENNLLTTGSGFSFQLGTIAKLTEEFRVGFTYTSSTWFRISEETSQYVAATRIDNGSTITQVINPNIINIFPDYRLQTPSKITGSLAYVFGSKGLLSFDYSRKDFSNTKFRPTTDSYFAAQNAIISDNLDVSNGYRLGGEYRYKQLSFRGGYRFEESPYKNETTVGDLSGYSLGLGYNFGSLSIDAAFSQAEREINYQLYSVGLTDSANINSTFTDIVITLAFSI